MSAYEVFIEDGSYLFLSHLRVVSIQFPHTGMTIVSMLNVKICSVFTYS